MKKICADATEALAGKLQDGVTIMSGGFGLCGIPATLIEAVRVSGAEELTIISNNAGIDDYGLGILLETRPVRKMISSYVGENKLFAQQYRGGELEIEFNPQGTIAERIRAGEFLLFTRRQASALLLRMARSADGLLMRITSLRPRWYPRRNSFTV